MKKLNLTKNIIKDKKTIINKIEKFLNEKNIKKFEDLILLNSILNEYNIYITTDINEFDIKNGKEIYRMSHFLSKGGTIYNPCIHLYILKMNKNKILLYGKIKNIYIIFEKKYNIKKYDITNKSNFVRKFHKFETSYMDIVQTIFMNIQLKIENEIADKLLYILENIRKEKENKKIINI